MAHPEGNAQPCQYAKLYLFYPLCRFSLPFSPGPKTGVMLAGVP